MVVKIGLVLEKVVKVINRKGWKRRESIGTKRIASSSIHRLRIVNSMRKGPWVKSRLGRKALLRKRKRGTN